MTYISHGQIPQFLDDPIKIEAISVLKGANYFSSGPVIVLRINLGVYNEVFTNAIPGFYSGLKACIPSLYEHHCSPGHIGGFLERVEEGTLLGHVTEHIAIELQTLAGMDVSYGKTRSAGQDGIYNVVFRYFESHCGIHAGRLAVHIVNSLLTMQSVAYDTDLEMLRKWYLKAFPSASFKAFIDEMEAQKIPYGIDYEHSELSLGTGKYTRKLPFSEAYLQVNPLSKLFPDARRIRIPLVSITGSRGKKQLTEMLYKCLKTQDFKIGRSNASQCFVNDDVWEEGHGVHGQSETEALIQNPALDMLIFETPLETIMYQGLPYDYARVGVLLNILDEHMGQMGLSQRSDLAYAKSVVIEQVLDKGFAVLNADDAEVMDLRHMVYSKLIVFSVSKANPHIASAMESGKDIAIYTHEDALWLSHFKQQIRLCELAQIALLQDPDVDLQLILALTACLYGLGKDADGIGRILCEGR